VTAGGPTGPRRPLRAAGASLRIAFDLLRTWLAPPDPDGRPPRTFDPATGILRRPGPVAAGDGGPALRLVSWNIHRHYDPDGVVRGLERIRRELDPDLLLLQEVPDRVDRRFWERPGVAAALAGLDLAWAPMHRVERPGPYYDFDASGQLTAGRRRLDGVSAVALPTVARPKLGRHHRFRRIGLVTEVALGSCGPVPVVNLHLENTARPAGRALQLERLLGGLGDGPAVVAGDLNTLFAGAEPLWNVAARWGFRPVELSGRRRLSPRLDHVLVRGLDAADGRELPIGGSDHRPLSAVVRVPRDAGSG